VKIDAIRWERVTVHCESDPRKSWVTRGGASVTACGGGELRVCELGGAEPNDVLYARCEFIQLTECRAVFTAYHWTAAFGENVSFDDLIRDGRAVPVTVTRGF